MLRRYVLSAAIVLMAAATLPLLAEKLPKANRAPTAITARQRELLAEGIALHDKGDFPAAAAKYQQVLEESPGVVEAIYELAFAQSAYGDCDKALTIALKGAEYRSELLPQFHMVIGNCLDELGRGEEAIDVYRAAIKLKPEFALLHFNLGLTYVRSEKLDEARKALQQSISLNPNHASSHLILSTVYQRQGYRVPAILGFSRFLLLEPDSPRVGGALQQLSALLSGGIRRGENPNEIRLSLQLQPRARTDEGDFDAVSVAITMSVAAAQMTNKEQPASPFQQLSGNYAVMSEVLSRTKGKGFAVTHYAPFFAELDKKDFVEAFVYHAFFAANIDGAEEWRKENEGKVRDFQVWFRDYQWQKKK